MREMLGNGSCPRETWEGAALPPAKRSLWVLAWLAFLPLVMIRAENFAESDTFWAIRTGTVTIARGAIPTEDPFSWTVDGEPWTLNAWGFNVILGAAYLVWGLAGSAIASSLFVATLGALVLLRARQLGATPVIAGWVLVLGGATMTTWISARPQIADYVAIVAIVLLLHRLHSASRPAWVLTGLALLTLVWVNLHAAAPLGAYVCGAATVGVLVSSRHRKQTGRFVLATLVVSLCCLINPYGAGIVAQALQVKDQSNNIKEWQSFDPTDPLQLTVMVAGLLAIAISARRRDPVGVAVLAALLCGSLAAYRILPIFLVLALPVLAAGAPLAVLAYFRSRRRMLRQGAAAAILIATVTALVNSHNLGRPDPAHFPASAIQQIPSGCNLYNDYQLGGLVILERPDVKVSIDSRNDLYGAARVDKSLETVAGHGDLNAQLQGADCVLVPPETGLAQFLRSSPAWKRTHVEQTAELFVRVVS